MKKFLYGLAFGVLGALASVVAWIVVTKRRDEIRVLADNQALSGIFNATEKYDVRVAAAREKITADTKEAVKIDFMARFGVKP